MGDEKDEKIEKGIDNKKTNDEDFFEEERDTREDGEMEERLLQKLGREKFRQMYENFKVGSDNFQ